MKYYEELLNLGCFSLQEVAELTGGNINTAKSLLKSYTDKGYVQAVKRNLYVAISLETGAPLASAYKIAANITPTAYISHRSVFAYKGYVNQVSYEINVSSRTRFKNFVFDGMEYVCNVSDIAEGIITVQGVRMTDTERTIVDYINDFDHIGGLEELLRGLDMITFVSTEKLMQYLALYDKAVLYQKAGYILEHFKDSLKLDSEFFEECKKKKGKSVRYFLKGMPKEDMIYSREWGLMIPKNLLYISQ